MSEIPFEPRPASGDRDRLPSDRRMRLGGILFLVSLLIFFLSSILLFGIYAWGRLDQPQTKAPLPADFLISTVLLIAISVMVHFATRAIRREKREWTSGLLIVSGLCALVFMGIQYNALEKMLGGPAWSGGTGKGVAGMVAVLALLHAFHVGGGIVALGFVSFRALLGKYDHERHWPVDFAAQYWHFLDAVWICMLLSFWLTTGGFG